MSARTAGLDSSVSSIQGYKIRKGQLMFSRIHAARGDETYRSSETYTLSDFPLLIGEILRRSERRSERKARARSLIHKIGAFFTNG